MRGKGGGRWRCYRLGLDPVTTAYERERRWWLALLSAGWEVVVLDKTTAPSTGIPTGVGLGLDHLSGRIINSWFPQQQSDNLLNDQTLTLTIDQKRR
ncbi:hypothetical protein L6452_29000 [Arctium lappa]|uniref:Uncharacterized protein n=1 Tax=Arctium lappa TaxID=4217 RepID=A0ACB8ZG51_ARCLA|nr:hypothetical protein L6452_29000 [Arctium lappa]